MNNQGGNATSGGVQAGINIDYEQQISTLTQQKLLLTGELGRKDVTIGQLTAERDTIHGERLRQSRHIVRLEHRIEELEARIEELKARLGQGRRTLHHEVTWQNMLRSGEPWDIVVKTFCKESNMSTKYTYVHPGIEFTPEGMAGSNFGSERCFRTDPASRTMSPRLSTPGSVNIDAADAGMDPGAHNPDMGSERPMTPFRIQELPVGAIRQIFEICLHKKGCLVHAVSRLDPYIKPTHPIDRPPHVFHYGKRTCSITGSGRDPNEVLAILLVCKRFLFLGIHAFYGLNTFAFSSLGEFSNFTDNIGRVRRARIQHIELAFVGNQYLTMRTGPDGEWASSRTLPLMQFSDMLRLRTMVIHINEMGNLYIRRKYEPEWLQRFQRHQTQGQPNFRHTRELRKLQGLDMLQSIRGMRWLRFYSWYPGTDFREKVRDWSFVEDMNNVCTLDMIESRLHFTQLSTLPCVFTNNDHDEDPDRPHRIQPYHMTDDDLRIIRDWYTKERDGGDAYDELRQNGLHRDTDCLIADPDAMSVISSDSSSIASSTASSGTDSSGDSDESDDGDDEGEHQDMDGDMSMLPEDELFVSQVRPGHEGPYIDLDAVTDNSEHFDIKSEFEDLLSVFTTDDFQDSAPPAAADETGLPDSKPESQESDGTLTLVNRLPAASEEACRHRESGPIIATPGMHFDLTLDSDNEANNNDDDNDDCEIVRVNRPIEPMHELQDDTQSLPGAGSKRHRTSSFFEIHKRPRSSAQALQHC